MKLHATFEPRAGSRQDKHEGESSIGLCDRLDRTRDNSQRQLPPDHDYAVPVLRDYFRLFPAAFLISVAALLALASFAKPMTAEYLVPVAWATEKLRSAAVSAIVCAVLRPIPA